VDEKEFIFHRKKEKQQIINNDFTLWKAVRKVKRPLMLATNDK